MRQWMYSSFALIWLGCSGTVDQKPSPLQALCMDACAHIHAKNCFDSPAIDVGNCEIECQQASSFAGNACTDEHAALYACTANATITCEGPSAETPMVTGCEDEEVAITKCESPGMTCTRAQGSDDVCFQFGLTEFFVCSEGIMAGPMCIQVTATGFCCP
jgi:hypothetical protein